MKKYYQELNLPDNPVIDINSLVRGKLKNTGYFLHLNPKEILSKEMMDLFDGAGLNPGYLVIFTNAFDGIIENRWVHSDVVSKKDPRTIQSTNEIEWRTCSFGINFELYQNENIFHWYETTEETKPLWPVIIERTPIAVAWLSGIHYGKKRDLGGVPDSLIHVETKTIKTKPILVRTDVPHSTLFRIYPGNKYRLAVSIRFYENWSWEEALEKFRPLFLENFAE